MNKLTSIILMAVCFNVGNIYFVRGQCFSKFTATNSFYYNKGVNYGKISTSKSITAHNGTLTIPSSPIVKLVSSKKNITYSFVGYIKYIDSYLVSAKSSETTSFILITGVGNTYKVWGMPFVSPSRNKIIFFSQGIEIATNTNGLQIFNFKNGIMSNQCTYLMETFEPTGIAWKDTDEIIIRCNKYTKEYNLAGINYLLTKVNH